VLRLRIVAAVASAAALTITGVAAAQDQTQLDGPDVASYQHPNGARIDWQKAADNGAGFAFVKATESTSYTNPYFADDYASAAAAGLVRSAYHFARPKPDLQSARDQADFFVKKAGTAKAKGDLPLTLDLEEAGGLSPTTLIAWTHAFVDEVTTLTSRPPILYTYPYFWQHAMGDTKDFANLPLWLASYRNGGPRQPLPGGWSSWTFWQYTASGHIAGIPASVDRSKFAGTQADLEALANPTPAAPNPTPLLPLPTLSPLG
jgi:lysozyme